MSTKVLSRLNADRLVSLKAEEASRAEQARQRGIQREFSGQSLGYKIARYLDKKTKSAFAGFGRASTLAGLTLPTKQANDALENSATSGVAAGALSRDFFTGNAHVSPEVLVQLQVDEQSFEQKFYADSKNTVPKLSIPAQEAFEQQLDRVSEEFSDKLGLRALFDENTGVVFAHDADKVDALQSASLSPASERIVTFSYNAAPQALQAEQLVTRFAPADPRIGGPAPAYA